MTVTAFNCTPGDNIFAFSGGAKTVFYVQNNITTLGVQTSIIRAASPERLMRVGFISLAWALGGSLYGSVWDAYMDFLVQAWPVSPTVSSDTLSVHLGPGCYSTVRVSW